MSFERQNAIVKRKIRGKEREERLSIYMHIQLDKESKGIRKNVRPYREKTSRSPVRTLWVSSSRFAVSGELLKPIVRLCSSIPALHVNWKASSSLCRNLASIFLALLSARCTFVRAVSSIPSAVPFPFSARTLLSASSTCRSRARAIYISVACIFSRYVNHSFALPRDCSVAANFHN